jgi:hypothetical protein
MGEPFPSSRRWPRLTQTRAHVGEAAQVDKEDRRLDLPAIAPRHAKVEELAAQAIDQLEWRRQKACLGDQSPRDVGASRSAIATSPLLFDR